MEDWQRDFDELIADLEREPEAPTPPTAKSEAVTPPLRTRGRVLAEVEQRRLELALRVPPPARLTRRQAIEIIQESERLSSAELQRRITDAPDWTARLNEALAMLRPSLVVGA